MSLNKPEDTIGRSAVGTDVKVMLRFVFEKRSDGMDWIYDTIDWYILCDACRITSGFREKGGGDF
jgi:hypothetical protein